MVKAPLVTAGGFINLKGNLLINEGIIESPGSNGYDSEKYYVGSSAGGVIKLDYDLYEIREEQSISIRGGKGDYPFGPSSGGKLVFFYDYSKIPVKEKDFQKYYFKESFVDVGYASF